MYIIRGTTPTLLYKFDQVDVSDITTAYLTIKAGTVIEKSLSDAIVGEDYISWTLSQAETLAFPNQVSAMINWKLNDGTRGASNKSSFLIENNYKDVII